MELKITEYKQVEVPLQDASVQQIVDLLDTFMENIYQARSISDYRTVLKGIGKWIDDARDGHDLL